MRCFITKYISHEPVPPNEIVVRNSWSITGISVFETFPRKGYKFTNAGTLQVISIDFKLFNLFDKICSFGDSYYEQINNFTQIPFWIILNFKLIIGLVFLPDVFCIRDRYTKHDGIENVTKGLMSRTIAAQVGDSSWYISLPSSANQVFLTTRTTTAIKIFRIPISK